MCLREGSLAVGLMAAHHGAGGRWGTPSPVQLPELGLQLECEAGWHSPAVATTPSPWPQVGFGSHSGKPNSLFADTAL